MPDTPPLAAKGQASNGMFPPIADFAFLSNCEQSCLIAPDGSVEWLCLPRPDSPSVFAALLDRAAGTFRFGPGNTHVPQHRRYVPGTMVLETTWQTPTGWMTVNDFLAMGPVQHEGRRPDYHRAPADFGAVGALVRIATCISGRVEAVVNCGPLFNYGAVGGTWSYKGDGYDAMTITAAEGDTQLDLVGTIPLGVMGARCYGRTTLTQGQSAFVTLSWGDARVPANQDEAFSALNTTVDFWRDWLSSAKIPDHPWKPYLDRSALTLKGFRALIEQLFELLTREVLRSRDKSVIACTEGRALAVYGDEDQRAAVVDLHLRVIFRVVQGFVACFEIATQFGMMVERRSIDRRREALQLGGQRIQQDQSLAGEKARHKLAERRTVGLARAV